MKSARCSTLALDLDVPSSIRYPKASAPKLGLESDKIELGKGQIVRWGADGAILALGAMLEPALAVC